MTKPLLTVKNLSVCFKTPQGTVDAVKNITFDIKRGETLALVGESGSGKSVSALSIMKLLPYPTASHGAQSSVVFDGIELINADENLMRIMRGQRIGMIFQEPQSALNPLHTIEKQIGEVLFLHQNMSKTDARARIAELMEMVGLPDLKDRLNAYPHQLSGGQRQRVMIAMALANNPELLIADEPTTALDVTIQAQILELLNELKSKLGMAMLMITHDLTIVEKMSDKVCVMQQGKIVEAGKTKTIFKTPKEAYTKKLLNARPTSKPPTPRDGRDILKAQNIKVYFPKTKSFFGKATSFVKAVDDISLNLKTGETLGVVGESGSGKTTLGLGILKLLTAQGNITFEGQDISGFSGHDMRPLREDMQIVFQDPYASLSPRMSVGQIISEGLDIHRKHLSKDEREQLVINALKDVHMDPGTRHRYPHEFSGGQRQRICIARAMVLHPKLVVLDEPTSALDLSVQAEVVDLLRELQDKYGCAYIFISHDLRVVRAMAHHVIVMQHGKVVEQGPANDVFKTPKAAYTRTLLNAALNLKAG
jgi:microcin C transport system ATP-binding protein